MANKKLASLPKIRSRRDFEFLSKKGKRVHINSWLLFNYKENQLGHLRCGWTIPKYVGNAVVRNRIRRWCREFFRDQRKLKWDPEIDLNVVVRKREKSFYKQLSHSEFKNILERGKNKLEQRL